MNKRFLIPIATILVLAVGWYLLSPLFINQTVNEDFPAVQETVQVQGTVPSQPAVSQETAPPDKVVVPAEATTAMQTAVTASDMTLDEAMPADKAEVKTLYQGDFYNVVHEGQGKASVYQLANGAHVLRLDDFQVLNGPDLHVYLATVDPVPNAIGSELPDSVDLGKLKGNIGNQNYDLPADLDLSKFKSVVIWCQPFRVPFIAARLAAP